jgi:transposase InsO family protein
VHKNPNIEQIYEKLFGLNKQLFSYWSENILFKTQWWITLGLLIILWIIVGGVIVIPLQKKTEFVRGKHFTSLEELTRELRDYVHWFNHIRIHGPNMVTNFVRDTRNLDRPFTNENH